MAEVFEPLEEQVQLGFDLLPNDAFGVQTVGDGRMLNASGPIRDARIVLVLMPLVDAVLVDLWGLATGLLWFRSLGGEPDRAVPEGVGRIKHAAGPFVQRNCSIASTARNLRQLVRSRWLLAA